MNLQRAAAGVLLCCCAWSAACNRSTSIDPRTRELAGLTAARTARFSSWEANGGNKDCATVAAGETRTLASVDGPGNIQRIYIGTTTPSGAYLREVVLRAYWDGEKEPSIEVPLGDFFLTSFEPFVRTVNSAMVVVGPGMGGLGSHGYGAYFPMPFDRGARITLENQGPRTSGQFCYHIEYEKYSSSLPPAIGRFHAQWRQESTRAPEVPEADRNKVQWKGTNTDGKNNYVILEAEGQGRLAGLLLSIDNTQKGWYGEGDDMIFIDGERWPPSYHGTGTEEIFGGGATPNIEFVTPYSGFHFTENRDGVNFAGKVSMFRWYVPDPIRFSKSIRWTIEHGHANNFEIDYTSVAYWYQTEPHKHFPTLPPAKDRIVKMPDEYFQARDVVLGSRNLPPELAQLPPETRNQLREMRKEGHKLFQQGRFRETVEMFENHRKQAEKLIGKGK